MKSSLRIIYALIVFILGIVMLSALTVLLIYENHQSQVSFANVSRSHDVRHALESIRSAIVHAESERRRYLITGYPEMVESFPQTEKLAEGFDHLDSLVHGDHAQKRSAAALRELFLKWQTHMDAIPVKNNADFPIRSENTLREIETGHHLVTQIQQLIEQMHLTEIGNLVRKQEDAKRHSVLPAIIGIGISIFSIIIFILAFYFTNSELKKSIQLNDELEAKNIQLEKYTQELSTFNNITSHDMQEPLRKIELFISMIEDRENAGLSPQAQHYFEKIKESVTRMRQLFFSILSFSLADQKRNAKERVDLNAVLSETLEALKVYIKDTNAVITSESLPVVYGVRHQLVQLFQNLISNALKYKRPDVIPEIIINYEIVEGKDASKDLIREARYYRINFQDNGIGFDQKYVDRIFDIFQRQVGTEKNGPGIGLSICRKIAHNHSGTITAESELDKGSLFSFFIPMKVVKQESKPAPI